jgi:diguanylate cyclase
MEKIMRVLEPRSKAGVAVRAVIFIVLVTFANAGFSHIYPNNKHNGPIYYVAHAIVVGGPFIVFFFIVMMFQVRLQRRLSHVSRKDGLTGLNNRNTFLDLAARRHNAAKYGVLLLLDADHFKKINDRHGHQTGDNCLKLIAYTIERNLRDNDVVGRIGGEEFAVYLSNTTLAQARVIAERFTKPIPFQSASDDTHLTVTLSVGAVVTRPDLTLGQMLGQADQGLYHAKAAGRARLVVWDEILSSEQTVTH